MPEDFRADNPTSPAALTSARMAASLLTEARNHYRIALTGPHRTGKTSLAQAYAESTGGRFIRSNVSDVLRQYGLDSSGDYSGAFEKRLTAQRHLLDHLDREWDQTPEGFITDRSPICFAMYTLSDVTGASGVSDAQFHELMQYIDDCKACTLKHFNVLVLLPLNPALPVVPDSGKASPSRAYIHHLYTVAHQLMSSIGTHGTGAAACPELPAAPCSAHASEEYRGTAERMQKMGGMAAALYSAMAEWAVPSLTRAVLPDSAVSLEERVNWLNQLTLSKLLGWAQQSVAASQESPMVMSMQKNLRGVCVAG